MKDTNTNFYLGLFLFGLVLTNVTLWIFVATRHSLSFADAKETYLSYFPAFLQNATLLTLLNVAFCAASLYLLIRIGESLSRFYNLIRIPVIILNTVLIAWNVFSLM